MTFIEMANEYWQFVVLVVSGLGVGYAIARKFEGLLGTDKKGNTVVERLERIEHQLYPNGGSSLSDKVDYIRRDQNRMKESISEISGELKVIKDIITVIVDK